MEELQAYDVASYVNSAKIMMLNVLPRSHSRGKWNLRSAPIIIRLERIDWSRGERMIRVLFICLGNICRSPMAEAISGI